LLLLKGFIVKYSLPITDRIQICLKKLCEATATHYVEISLFKCIWYYVCALLLWNYTLI